MKKQKLTDRLQLFNGGRAHYLEFLRNLTPQIILLSITLLIGAKLDFSRFDIGNWLPTTLFFFLFGSFALAFYANSTLFYERCFSNLIQWRLELFDSLNAQEIKGWRRFFEKLRALWKEKLVEALEVMVVIWFFQIAFAIVIVMSLHSASGIWQATHHAG